MSAVAKMSVFAGLSPPYGTVVIDAPWDHGITQRFAGKDRTPSVHGRYERMAPSAIAGMPVEKLLGEAGHVWLWVTNAVLAAGWHSPVLKVWGLRPVTIVTWCKSGRLGLGRYVRGSTEHAVLAVKGFGSVPETAWPRSWLESPRGRHSVKPAAFGDMVEQVSPGPYVELFARQPRLGWSSWGTGYRTEEETA